MPHIITGEIRKEPRIKQNGNGTLYVVELSESYKDREDNRQYTNYTFFFNDGGRQGLQSWYAEAFQVGKVISVSCDQLRVEIREHNGKTYTTLLAAGFPSLLFSQRGDAPQQQQSSGWGQPQQPSNQQGQRHSQQQQSNNQPPMDFDDDIPF